MGKGASPEGDEKFYDREIGRIARKLVQNYWAYFTKYEELNSDGMRLLASATRYARGSSPYVRAMLRRALREPKLSNIIKLLESLGADREELESTVRSLIQGSIYAWG